MNQLSSLWIYPQIKTLILLDLYSKHEPLFTIKSAISVGESVERLLVPHNTTLFFNNVGIDRFMVRQGIFCTCSPHISNFNVSIGVKYLCHAFKYLKVPAIMESPSNKVLVN